MFTVLVRILLAFILHNDYIYTAALVGFLVSLALQKTSDTIDLAK